MSDKISIMDLFKIMPLDEMKADAKTLKVDYKVKKLDALTLLALLIQGYLMTNRLSQRYVCRESELLPLKKLYGLNIFQGGISHSSLSERLSKINPQFFEDTYKRLYSIALDKYGSSPLVKSNIVRVDTTLVAETCNKLLEGISTGVNDRYKGERKQIKYGIAFDGFGVMMADIFSKQTHASDDISLAQTVKDAIRCSDGHREVYTFDRGVSSSDNLKEINDLTKETNTVFVARLRLERCLDVVETNPLKDYGDDELEILSDQRVHLRLPKSTQWDTSTVYRVITVRFRNKRPKSSGAKSHRRKYSEEMRLITNDMESDALTIVQEYKVRWSIEVFYRFLKQNLSFSHLLSVNLNGIKVMLYMTLIVALLVKIFELESTLGPTAAIQEMQIQIANWLYLNSHPEETSQLLKTPPRKMEDFSLHQENTAQ